ncbi:hypothetical protein GQX74_015030 [Glossina fuscipes]|nr:hypothetical protein GQX74_015030 [Glossina fuscipes]
MVAGGLFGCSFVTSMLIFHSPYCSPKVELFLVLIFLAKKSIKYVTHKREHADLLCPFTVYPAEVSREVFLSEQLLQIVHQIIRKFVIRFQEFCDDVNKNIENKITRKAKFKARGKNGRINQINNPVEDGWQREIEKLLNGLPEVH